jgi:hypothetical protein
MNEQFTKRWFEQEKSIRADIEASPPESYKDLVSTVLKHLEDDTKEECINASTLSEVSFGGCWEGTKIFMVASDYGSDTIWYCKVEYGSCSACDTLEGIKAMMSDEEDATEEEKKEVIDRYMLLALHIVQRLKVLE